MQNSGHYTTWSNSVNWFLYNARHHQPQRCKRYSVAVTLPSQAIRASPLAHSDFVWSQCGGSLAELRKVVLLASRSLRL